VEGAQRRAHPDADGEVALRDPRRLARQRRGEQHRWWPVHELARLVDHDTDGAATTRAILIGRAGGTTPSSSWQVYRNNAQPSLRPPPTTPRSRSARSSMERTSRCGGTTGVRFRRPPRLPSTARALLSASPATRRSDRRQDPMWPSGGSSRPLAAQRIGMSCMPTRRHSSA
jgi:hypothetical protein